MSVSIFPRHRASTSHVSSLLVTGKANDLEKAGRPPAHRARGALSVAAGVLAFSGGPVSADVTCPTVNPLNGAVPPAPSPGVDWQGCNLAYAAQYGADLANANLSQAILTGANPGNENLANANLAHADLTNAVIEYGTLPGANLTDASLTNADLEGTSWSGADLTHASLAGANLSYGTLTTATVTGTNLTGANLTAEAGFAVTGTPSSLPAHWSLRYHILMGQGAVLSDAP
jgi:uncharacterized protein YjbI with pentapeptide repeats